MIVSDIQTAARDQYNAVGDSFFSDAQMQNFITQGCNEFCKDAGWLIDGITTSSTVAAQQAYSWPTNAIAINRIVIRGRKIKRITFRQDDSITLSDQQSQQSGLPVYYSEFNFKLYFRPIPDDVYTMQIFSHNMHTPITSNSQALEIPTLFHFDLVDYCLYRMFIKDKDAYNVQIFKGIWAEHIAKARSWKARQKRADSFVTVQDEETLPVTILGEA